MEGVEGLQPATEDGIRDILNALAPAEDVVFTLTGIRNTGSLSCSLGAVTTGDAGTYNIIVLVTQDSREFDEPPGSNGETLFRHAVRGAMPNAAGEDTELTSLAAVWFEWQTDLAWMEFGGPIRLHALARKQGE